MKKIKIIGLILILTLLISIIIFSCHKYQENKEQLRSVKEAQEQNYLFTHDVINSLIYMEKAFKPKEIKDFIEEDAEYQFLKKVYNKKEDLLDAKNKMEQWNNSENIKINEIANDMLDGINDFIASTEAIIRVAEGNAIPVNQDLATFQVKLDKGAEKIIIASIMIDSNFSLSDVQKIELIFYINTNFKEAMEEWTNQEVMAVEPIMQAPAAAAMLIKGSLEGVGTDWDKIEEGF